MQGQPLLPAMSGLALLTGGTATIRSLFSGLYAQAGGAR